MNPLDLNVVRFSHVRLRLTDARELLVNRFDETRKFKLDDDYDRWMLVAHGQLGQKAPREGLYQRGEDVHTTIDQ